MGKYIEIAVAAVNEYYDGEYEKPIFGIKRQGSQVKYPEYTKNVWQAGWQKGDTIISLFSLP